MGTPADLLLKQLSVDKQVHSASDGYPCLPLTWLQAFSFVTSVYVKSMPSVVLHTTQLCAEPARALQPSHGPRGPFQYACQGRAHQICAPVQWHEVWHTMQYYMYTFEY